MFSVKKNVQILIAALKAYEICDIVLSPGSRNAPLIHTFANCSLFNNHLVVDERSAAFFALGIIQKERKPVVVCCTSGTALLNYAPAIAEAYYQQLPLIVISADRAEAWIGQMDGQTIPQNNIFHSITNKSVQLPEIHTDEEMWYCERLIHESILSAQSSCQGPVHINIPISEPLFDFSEKSLPEIKPINYVVAQKADLSYYLNEWKLHKKRMIVIGQLKQNNQIRQLIPLLTESFDCVILAEHISNIGVNNIISNFDTLLYSLSDIEKLNFAPDLLISFGGHIVSKRLKQFLRKNKPKQHWHLNNNHELIDLFQSLTDSIKIKPEYFLSELIDSNLCKEKEKTYFKLWETKSLEILPPNPIDQFCDLYVVNDFIKSLPKHSILFLANSSSVRNAQFFNIDSSISILCNRGTNGIEGTLSTASGFTSGEKNLVFLLIGDLSFFYDLNALCYNNLPTNLRILLINNSGGAIFHQLPIIEKTPEFFEFVGAEHSETARRWIAHDKIEYLSVSDTNTLQSNMTKFVSPDNTKPILLEVFTSIEKNTIFLKEYYNNLKK